MIEVTPNLSIHENEIEEHFVRASGPGGQHVNKASTAVQLRFDIPASSLPPAIKKRLKQLAGNRVNAQGVLLLQAQSHRSQDRNREEARQRLLSLIRKASKRPKDRKRTKPSRAAKQRRLENKKHQAQKKRRRRYRPRLDE